VRVKPKQRTTDDARQHVREICDPWDLDVNLNAGTFHRILPTPELRTAYMVEFHEDWLNLSGLCHNAMGFRESAEEACFRRWDIDGFLAKHKRAPFELPDLWDVWCEGRAEPIHTRNRRLYDAVQSARAEWWIACRLPVTKEEIDWLRRFASDFLLEARECCSDIWEARQFASAEVFDNSSHSETNSFPRVINRLQADPNSSGPPSCYGENGD
jgi:hypothetical protein